MYSCTVVDGTLQLELLGVVRIVPQRSVATRLPQTMHACCAGFTFTWNITAADPSRKRRGGSWSHDRFAQNRQVLKIQHPTSTSDGSGYLRLSPVYSCIVE